MRLRHVGVLLAAGLAAAAHGADEAWICVESPHFTVFTPAGRSPAKKWAVTLELFYQALVQGIGERGGAPPHASVVLFRRDSDFQPYKPLENGRPARIGGFFWRLGDVNVIALSLQHQDDEQRRTIQHEAVHWFFSAQGQAQALWLKEGLAEAYSTFRIVDSRHGEFGAVIPQHLAFLREYGFMPLRQLLAVTPSSIQYNEARRAGVFYAESWLLVHYLIFSTEFRAGAQIDRYESEVNHEVPKEVAFQHAFGLSPEDMQSRLENYVTSAAFRVASIPLNESKISQSLRLGPAREGDVEMALGSILIGTRDRAEAERDLRRAAYLLTGEPRPWECLGQLALYSGNPAEAADYYARAASLGSKNQVTFFNYALTRLGIQPEASLTVPSGIKGDLVPSINALRQALVLDPNLIEAYQAFAWLIGNSPMAGEQDLELLQQGAARAPSDPLIAAGLGAAEIKTGRMAQGRRRLMALASRPNGPGRFAHAILEAEAEQELNRQLSILFVEKRYADVAPAIARFETDHPEQASAGWDRLQKIKRQAAAALPSPSPPAGRSSTPPGG